MTFVSTLLILLITQQLQAVDLKFRFKEGFCQKHGSPGTNPEHFGECGNITGNRLINKQEKDLVLLGSNLNSTYTYVSRFSGGDLSHLSMQRAVVLQSQFVDLKAQSLNLRGAHVKGSSFQSVDLKRLQAIGARLSKTQFINCDLQDADFWGSQLLNVSFKNSDLRGVNFSNTFLLLADFTGAKFDGTTQLPFPEEEAKSRGMVKVD